MSDPSDRVKEIFLEAIEKHTPEKWPSFLEQACAGDAALRAGVEQLLRARSELGSFHEPPRLASLATADDPVRERAGTVIGPYKLMQEIGEGGMGAVWMAQQTEPVKRLVALKVIKPGMDSRQVIARFEAERQALALMDHPNIARVFDAGTTSAGRPYFVMELVKGVPLTKYCDERRLTPRERLELFIPVCQAIQHAHQKGIIHRDIKPSNVLVALYDGKPVPKVIDFGVAKATGQQLTEHTLVTGFGAVVGTLQYMSPEQAELNQLDIDTRSDIYSLGVLLYELLTGSTPLDKKRLKEAAMLEVLRLIREEEAPNPSRRLSTTDEMPSVAANRGLEPKKLSGVVRGELDWIVMKALAKERERRYETANGFARDIQRYLADEPVQACPPSAWYRFAKFRRRNKGALAVAGLILFFITLVGGGGGWVVRDRTARQAKTANDLELALDRAELFQGQGKRAEALTALDRAELLAGQAAADPARDARLAALKERLAAEARDQQFIAEFEAIRLRVQSAVDLEQNNFHQQAAFPAIRDALGRYGIGLGDMMPDQAAALVRGRPETVRRNLIAAFDECVRWAPRQESRTRQWLLAVLTAADNDVWRERVRKAVAERNWQVLEQLAGAVDVRTQPPSFLLYVAGTLPEPRKSTRLELLRRTQRAYPADLWVNHQLACELRESGQPAEAVRYYTAALALRPDNPGIYLNRGVALNDAGEVDAAIADHRQALALAPRYSEAHINLGNALRVKGQLEEAIAEYREAIRIKKDYPPAHNNLGLSLQDKGQLDEAIDEYREAIRIKKDFSDAHYNLGNALNKKGQSEEAIAEYCEAIRIKKDYPLAHNNLGNALRDKGQLEEAIAEYREAIRFKKDFSDAHYNLGLSLNKKGQSEEAIAEFREAIRFKKDFSEAHNNLGLSLQDKGQLEEAIVEYREAIRIKRDFAKAHNNLGNALRDEGQLEEAIAEYREAIRIKKDYHLAHYNLGLSLQDKGQLEEAIAEYREVIRIKKDCAEAHCNLGHCLVQKGQFHQAVKELRCGHELGSKNPRWPYPSAQWLRQCERLVELDGKLPSFLEGKTTPASAAERIELAGVCSLKGWNRAAARFYEEALVADPKLNARHRYNAACAAALAGCGKGKDADKLEGKERSRLRGQALDWLRADLAAVSRLPDKESDKARSAAEVAKVLRHWNADADFAGVRGPRALAKLPEAERQPWQKLWKDVFDALLRAQRNATPQKKSDAK